MNPESSSYISRHFPSFSHQPNTEGKKMTLKQDYDPYDPLPMLDSEDVGKYFKVEDSYMAAKGYARNKHAKKYRERAVLLISKVSSFSRLSRNWKMLILVLLNFTSFFFFFFLSFSLILCSTQITKTLIL